MYKRILIGHDVKFDRHISEFCISYFKDYDIHEIDISKYIRDYPMVDPWEKLKEDLEFYKNKHILIKESLSLPSKLGSKSHMNKLLNITNIYDTKFILPVYTYTTMSSLSNMFNRSINTNMLYSVDLALIINKDNCICVKDRINPPSLSFNVKQYLKTIRREESIKNLLSN